MTVGIFVKNIANLITLSRIAFALAMALAEPFSALFWVFYLLGGLSDILDGFAARRLGTQSALGARLDSVADIAFSASLAVVAVRAVRFPAWLWLCILGVALIRISAYVTGFVRFHTFASLHTHLNKAAGALIFAFPVLYALLGLTVTGILLCAVALLSSAEELIILATSGVLERDCRGLLQDRRKNRNK